MTKKLLVVDADTLLYSSAAQQQVNKCLATNIEYGSQRLFESKTAFNEWIKENNRDKTNYSCETKSEIKPDAEPRFAFQSIKQKVDKIVNAAGCDDFVLCIEGEGNFRKDLKSRFVDYKGQRSEKPILFEECREFFLKKYTYSSKRSDLTSAIPILSLTAVNSSNLSESIISSISSSISSGIFIPLLLKYFTPLNSYVLCDAEITTLASAFSFLVKYATPGVGITPKLFTFAP